MTKEMEFFIFLMEQYASYKNTTADKVLRQLGRNCQLLWIEV